jgi:phosphoglycolate phosphatase
MIGDTAYDMAMARNAGVHGIGVTWGYHTHAHLTEAGAGMICHTFEELARHLDTRSARLEAAP